MKHDFTDDRRLFLSQEQRDMLKRFKESFPSKEDQVKSLLDDYKSILLQIKSGYIKEGLREPLF